MPYHVLIIEDDSMVAAIDRQYVESDRRFQVDRVFKNGLPALDYLAEHRADLVILDYYTPQMNGQEFLDRLLALPGPAPAVIAVTSANDPDIVQALLQRGVLDYLIKPFVPVPPGHGPLSPAAEPADPALRRGGPADH